MSNWTNNLIAGSREIPVFRLIPLQLLNRFLCCALGIPLNLLVVIVILRSRQLWSARNIFWLAVTFFNLLALTQSVTELTIFYLYRRADESHETLCKMYSLLRGYPYALLLAGLALASWDRYLALVRLQFYQHYATPRNVILILVFVFLVITGGHTLHYWLGILPKCGVHFGWMSLTLSFQSVLSTVCLAIQYKLFLFVRSCIRYAANNKEMNTMEMISYSSPTVTALNDPKLRSSENDDLSRMNRLELQAARILGLGILPFCLVSFILCICSVGLIVYRVRGQEGFWLWVVMVILREFLLIHLVYIPAVFTIQSREFRGAVQRFCRNRRRKPTAQLYG